MRIVTKAMREARARVADMHKQEVGPDGDRGQIRPRVPITAAERKAQTRERLAADVERFLAAGGAIEPLPPPGDSRTRKVGFGAGMGRD